MSNKLDASDAAWRQAGRSKVMPDFEPLVRTSVPTIEEIIGKPFHVLDDGFVRLIDYMGDDTAVVQAARVLRGTRSRWM